MWNIIIIIIIITQNLSLDCTINASSPNLHRWPLTWS